MPFRLLISLLLVLIASTASAGLHWDRDVLVVETVADAKTVSGSFPFENTGPAPVTIKSIKTNCGCTAATTAKKTWQPGEHGDVSVTLAIGSRRGFYETPVTVVTDDPAAPRTVLKFRPLIRDLLEIVPTFVFWTAAEPPTIKNVSIKVATPGPLADLQVASQDPCVSARLETVVAGREYILHMTPADGAVSGRAVLKITAQQPGQAPREFIVRAKVR